MKIALLCCSFLVFPALSHAQDSQTFGGPSGVTGEERDIREILDYVENKGECWLRPDSQKKLAGNRKMWKFKQFYKGIKDGLNS